MNFYQSTEDLTGLCLSESNPLIICPSPLVADGLRRLMPSSFEMITISKWIGDYLKSQDLKRSNKSELMLRLSSVWRHYFPEEEAHLFFKAFELFTDLRSYALNLELISEFLKEIDPISTKSILIFWAFLENEKIIDEQKSYQIQSTQEIVRPVWVIGFKHLSGVQIDMLKVIAEKTEVRVFFPKEVYPETFSTDWIRWLAPEIKTHLEKTKKKIKIIYFPKNKLNVVLNSLHKKIDKFDMALASAHLSFNNKQEVRNADQFFKSPEDLFYAKREKLIEELTEDLKIDSLDLDIFCERIEEKKEIAIKDEDFISYKTLLLLLDSISFYREFQTKIDLFSLKILRVILELNSPRVALSTLTEFPSTRILELNELPYRKGEHSLVLIASSNYGPLKTVESKYSERMIDSLKAIAPVKRAGLDFLYLKNEIIQLLSDQNNFLLMEEGLELVDIAWREILKDFEIIVVDPKTEYSLKKKKDYLADKIKPGPFPIKNFSASRLQSYLDCPRKYYFSYIEKMNHRPDERMKISADEMGTIEHQIIEKYFENKIINNNLVYDFAEHEKLCNDQLNDFLGKNKVSLNEKIRVMTYYELLHFTQNGIEFLVNFCKDNFATGIIFEQFLDKNPLELVGAIDCVIELAENKVALFDFKRSSAAIGSKKETMTFDKIQIWVYLFTMIRYRNKVIHSWGYLNLSDTCSSQLYNEIDTPILNDQLLDNFQRLLVSTIENLKNEKKFYAAPRINKICDFCEVQLFCDKGSCL